MSPEGDGAQVDDDLHAFAGLSAGTQNEYTALPIATICTPEGEGVDLRVPVARQDGKNVKDGTSGSMAMQVIIKYVVSQFEGEERGGMAPRGRSNRVLQKWLSAQGCDKSLVELEGRILAA